MKNTSNKQQIGISARLKNRESNVKRIKKNSETMPQNNTQQLKSDYNNLLKKSGKTKMEEKRLRNLATDIFKTLNNINPTYLKEIFKPNVNYKVRPISFITVKGFKTTKYDTKT